MRKVAVLLALVTSALSGCASMAEPDWCPAERGRLAAHFGALPDWDIAWMGTALTQATYRGSCACPDHEAEDGSRCGLRSAYSKGAPLACSADEIPRADLPRIRARLVEVSASPACGGLGQRSWLEWPASREAPAHWR